MLGIKKDDMNFRNHRDVVYEEREFAACACAVEPSLADKLKAPTTEESEEIEVIWLIES